MPVAYERSKRHQQSVAPSGGLPHTTSSWWSLIGMVGWVWT